jgi:GT2 family glycosyltransferase
LNPYFSIVIPNWNGEVFITRGISSLLISARASKKPFEFIIVDDASSDSSPAIIAETFPDIKLLRNKKNLGFGHTVNRGVAASKAPFIILANNDLVVKEDFITRLLEPFNDDKDSKLFGVSARTVNWTDGSPNHLNMTAHFEKGLIEIDFNDSKSLCKTLFLQGGACSIRRKEFIEMGGLCSLFKPGYWEDYDLSYRAAVRGYKLLYSPGALAYHLGKGSLMKVLGKDGINTISSRNYFYFTWLNLRDPGLLLSHFINLPVNLFKEFFEGKELRLLKGFIKAFPNFPKVLKERRKRTKKRKIQDRMLL